MVVADRDEVAQEAAAGDVGMGDVPEGGGLAAPSTGAGPTGPSATSEGATAGSGAPAFGPQDPETRARRLARALVSDIKVYNPERWQESRDEGTLRTVFRDEILKSWEEYVEQVGEPMAKKTPYFRNALNEILAEGNRVF